MKKALVIYHSRTGTTKKLGTEIAQFYKQNGLDAKVISIEEFNANDLTGIDHVLLGCWTQGLLLFNQHPDKKWVKFARQFPSVTDKKLVLFTTYKIATGSMFRRMKERIQCNPENVKLEIKSRNGRLSDQDKQAVVRLLKQ